MDTSFFKVLITRLNVLSGKEQKSTGIIEASHVSSF